MSLSMRVAAVAAPVRQQIVATMRTAIATGRFEPGQRLVERDLCELMGVSRTSVREALRQLESEGLIDNIPNRGPVVSRLSREDIASIYQVRGVLEALAAQLFTGIASDAQVVALERAVEAIAQAYKSGNVDRVLEAKTRFYRILIEGSGNAIIASVLRTMNARIDFLRRVSLSSPRRHAQSLRELRAVVAAVKRREGVAAFEASQHHVEAAGAAAIKTLGVGAGIDGNSALRNRVRQVRRP